MIFHHIPDDPVKPFYDSCAKCVWILCTVRNRFLRTGPFLAAGLIAAFALTSCSALSGYFPGNDSQPESSVSSPDVSGSASTPEEYTLQGTLNQIDQDLKFLVLIADDLYFRFDFSNTDIDMSSFSPGDSVTVTYTGLLEPDSEDVTAQLVSMDKNS